MTNKEVKRFHEFVASRVNLYIYLNYYPTVASQHPDKRFLQTRLAQPQQAIADLEKQWGQPIDAILKKYVQKVTAYGQPKEDNRHKCRQHQYF